MESDMSRLKQKGRMKNATKKCAEQIAMCGYITLVLAAIRIDSDEGALQHFIAVVC